MMTTTRIRPVLLLCLCGALGLAPVQADEPETTKEETTLIVKVPTAGVEALAKAVRALGGRAYDLESLRRIDREPAAPATADVAALTLAVIGAEEANRAQDAGFRIEKFTAKRDQASLKVIALDVTSLDRFVEALGRIPAADGAETVLVERGAIQRDRSGRLRADVRLRRARVPLPSRAAAGGVPGGPIAWSRIQAVALEAGVQPSFASAERTEQPSGSDIAVVSRDLGFPTCDRDAVVALLRGLAAAEDLFVAEVQLRALDDRGDTYDQPRIRVATLRRVPR
jgi:hypothetical protein